MHGTIELQVSSDRPIDIASALIGYRFKVYSGDSLMSGKDYDHAVADLEEIGNHLLEYVRGEKQHDAIRSR